MDLKELALVDPDRHWYYQAKLAALRAAMRRHADTPRRIVDVGAGSGFFSTRLAGPGGATSVLCVDPNYDADRVEGAVEFARSVDPVAGAGDVYLFIDVLEHVDDDLGLLRAYTDHAPAGAIVLITVPAFMSMWSAHDEYLEHRRRYRLGELRSVVAAAGLEVMHRRYLFGTLFPVAWAVRRARRSRPAATDLRAAPLVVDRVLTALLNAEHRLRWNRLAGLSAFVVARVPDRG